MPLISVGFFSLSRFHFSAPSQIPPFPPSFYSFLRPTLSHFSSLFEACTYTSVRPPPPYKPKPLFFFAQRNSPKMAFSWALTCLLGLVCFFAISPCFSSFILGLKFYPNPAVVLVDLFSPKPDKQWTTQSPKTTNTAFQVFVAFSGTT